MANLQELKIPDIGGSTDVSVVEIYVKVGDSVKVDDNLIMLETDKASVEVPATYAGIVKHIALKPGAKVNEGDVILSLEVSTENNNHKQKDHEVTADAVTVSSTAAPIQAPEPVPVAASSVSSNIAETTTIATGGVANMSPDQELSFAKAFASPVVRKLARELGVNLGEIKGSGSKERVTADDVKEFVKLAMSTNSPGNSSLSHGNTLDLLPLPKIDFAKFGDIEVKPIPRIKKLSGANLARNWVIIPHVTQFDEADITELEEFRRQLNNEYKNTELKLSPLAFIIKACVFSCQKFPEFNCSLDGDNLVYKKYYNIGFAADTPQGLVVPVLKDADKKGLVDIATETSALAGLARAGKLKPTDMQGGTFTISSLGGIGGTAFTPIINAPEVAILGISKSSIKPVWDGTTFVPRLLMPLSLSYDHRIIDGALAAKFTTYLAQLLADIRRLIL